MALRIVMLAGGHSGRLTVDELADQLELPRHHVAKVVQRLQHLGVLVTVRGRNGGVTFADPAREMTVGEVVRHLEGPGEVVNCETPACPFQTACRLRAELGQAQHAFLHSLDRVRLGDLFAAPDRPLPVGRVPSERME